MERMLGSALNAGAARTSLDFRAFWLICTLGAVEGLWIHAAGLRLTQGAEALVLIALPLGIGLALDALGVGKRIALAANFLALWLAWMILGCILSYLFASLNFPLQDENLARLDASLGFDWVGWFRFVESYPVFDGLLMAAYLSMLPQVALSIVCFSHPERVGFGRELWWSTMVAVVITCAISGVLPALCAWDHHKTAEALNIHIPHLVAIRAGTLDVLPIMSLKALLTFPSFHAVMAVLLTYPYRRIRTMFPVILCLNALMLLSIPKHGGHYLVDILGGVAVAVLSIALVRSFLSRGDKPRVIRQPVPA